jgi:hypothetical protein
VEERLEIAYIAYLSSSSTPTPAPSFFFRLDKKDEDEYEYDYDGDEKNEEDNDDDNEDEDDNDEDEDIGDKNNKDDEVKIQQQRYPTAVVNVCGQGAGIDCIIETISLDEGVHENGSGNSSTGFEKYYHYLSNLQKLNK